MRFLHTGDIHLGRKINNLSLLEDQIYILNQIVDICVREKVDCLFVCGDVYNNTSPTPDSMSALNDFLNKLVDKNIKTFIIYGNHDSDQRVAYLSNLVKKSNIYLSDKFDGNIETITVKDDFGDVVIHLLPFVKASYARKIYPKEKIESFDDAIRAILKNHKVDKTKRNIILAHQHVTGAEFSDVEEKFIGGLDNVNANVFDDFDYVALGHIHKSQVIERETLRYSGSIMKYSFSEERHTKTVTLVDFNDKINDKVDINISLIPLEPRYNLRTIRGYFEDVKKVEPSNDFIRVILTDEEVNPDARSILYTQFPNIVSCIVDSNKTKKDILVNNDLEVESLSIIDLFKEFYKLQNNNCELNEEHLKVLTKIINNIK